MVHFTHINMENEVGWPLPDPSLAHTNMDQRGKTRLCSCCFSSNSNMQIWITGVKQDYALQQQFLLQGPELHDPSE